MKLTKYVHACVTLEKRGTTIAVDPGLLTPDAAEVVAGADAVLITHDHFDHFAEELIAQAVAARPELRVFGPASVAAKLGDRATAVAAGQSFTIGDFEVEVHGEHHALIHPDIPTIDNVGYLVDGSLYHPGDAYHVPGGEVETLLLPTSGPWTKVAEAVDYVRAVKPRRLIQIHELMLSDLGQQSLARFLGEGGLPGVGPGGLTGIPLTILPAGDSLDL
ncbi:MBL fold metallo-hydrolase [Saccharothrix coeruleofusca]|uniref:MBL fold metallo-hydrolase n=1 Tax=Saccharothrix coeruleofusca TaxID=33919 RepID=A0A918AJR2_9PSEU|nr:MBL fold metallo-hydrolase [Saccharothrix coeruleofusca]GGP37932.1 MBL fold metallo-hydrolase [Saccharothrix coeruleofusca]